MKNEILRLRVTEDLKSKVTVAAEKEGLSVSAYITRLLTLNTQENEKTNA